MRAMGFPIYQMTPAGISLALINKLLGKQPEERK